MKVAFHLGSTKVQNFIYNQIISIIDENNKILIFGTNIHFNSFIKHNELKLHLIPQNKFYNVLYLIYNLMILMITQPNRFLTLISCFSNLKKMKLLQKIIWLSRVVPVLINLPDILHIQWAKSIDSWMFLKYNFGVKIVLSLRGTHINCSPLNDKDLAMLYRKNFPIIDRFHAVSESLAKEAIKYGAQKKKIEIISSPINSKYIKIKKESWGIKKEFNLISVGRNNWVKGYHIALSAIKKIYDSGININYTIITKEAPSEEILYQIDDLNLENIVFFRSYNDQNKIFKAMAQSDCFLLPSITEGTANVVLEAMFLQLPVISSDCGGMKELIKNGYNGFLFNNRDHINLVEVLNYFLNISVKEKFFIVRNAKNLITKNNDIQIIGEKMKSFYQKC